MAWTNKMDETLRSMRAAGTPYHLIAERLAISDASCRVRAQKIGVAGKKRCGNKKLIERAERRLARAAALQVKAQSKQQRHRVPSWALIGNAEARKAGQSKDFRRVADEPEPLGERGGGCLWLHGQPVDRNFCGHERRVGSAYCEHHAARTVSKAARSEAA